MTNPTADRTPCTSTDPELWFAEQPARLAVAKELCAGCPLKQSCLAGALDRREPWGVWGGEIVEDGVVLAYKRGRGRPSNAERRLGLVTMTADGRRRRYTGRSRSLLTSTGPLTTTGRAETFRSRSA